MRRKIVPIGALHDRASPGNVICPRLGRSDGLSGTRSHADRDRPDLGTKQSEACLAASTVELVAAGEFLAMTNMCRFHGVPTSLR